jgi:hypothetical protein
LPGQFLSGHITAAGFKSASFPIINEVFLLVRDLRYACMSGARHSLAVANNLNKCKKNPYEDIEEGEILKKVPLAINFTVLPYAKEIAQLQCDYKSLRFEELISYNELPYNSSVKNIASRLEVSEVDVCKAIESSLGKGEQTWSGKHTVLDGGGGGWNAVLE